MMNLRRSGVLVLCLVAVGCAAPTDEPDDDAEKLGTTSSALTTIWQTGVRVESPVATPGLVDTCVDSEYTETNGTVACVKRQGDYIWVKDKARDGRSALGVVETISSTGGVSTRRFCRNPHGAGTWARCNFDWSEGPAKHLTVGTFDGDTQRSWVDYLGGILFTH